MGVGVTPKVTVVITLQGESLTIRYTLWVSTSTNEYPLIKSALDTPLAIRFIAFTEV